MEAYYGMEVRNEVLYGSSGAFALFDVRDKLVQAVLEHTTFLSYPLSEVTPKKEDLFFYVKLGEYVFDTVYLDRFRRVYGVSKYGVCNIEYFPFYKRVESETGPSGLLVVIGGGKVMTLADVDAEDREIYVPKTQLVGAFDL